MSNEYKCEYAMSHEVQNMCTVAQGPNHGPAPLPEEGKWIQARQISDISAYTHGVGWCAPQQGACKLSLNVKNGIIEEVSSLRASPWVPLITRGIMSQIRSGCSPKVP